MKAIAFHESGAREDYPFEGARVPVHTGEIQVSDLSCDISKTNWYPCAGSKAPPSEGGSSAALTFIPGQGLHDKLHAGADYLDGIAPGEIGLGMIPFEGFSNATYQVGQPRRMAKQTYLSGVEFGTHKSATTPTHGRSKW